MSLKEDLGKAAVAVAFGLAVAAGPTICGTCDSRRRVDSDGRLGRGARVAVIGAPAPHRGRALARADGDRGHQEPAAGVDAGRVIYGGSVLCLRARADESDEKRRRASERLSV